MSYFLNLGYPRAYCETKTSFQFIYLGSHRRNQRQNSKGNKGHTNVWGTALGTFYWGFSKKLVSESLSNKQGFWDIYRLNPFNT